MEAPRLTAIKEFYSNHVETCECDICWLLREVERLTDITSSPKVTVQINGMDLVKAEIERLDAKINRIRQQVEQI